MSRRCWILQDSETVLHVALVKRPFFETMGRFLRIDLMPLLIPMDGEAVHAGTNIARTYLGSFRHPDRYSRTSMQGFAPGELYLDK